MKPSEYMKIITEIEKDLPVHKWSVNNVLIWPIIRLDIGMLLHNKGQDVQKENNQTNKKLNQKQITFSLKSLLFPLRLKNKSKDKTAVFLSHSLTKTKIENKWYDRITVPIIEELKKKSIPATILEYTPGYQKREPSYFPVVPIQEQLDRIRFTTKIMNKIKRNKVYAEGYDKLENIMKSLQLNVKPLSSYVKYTNLIIRLSNFYEKTLKDQKAGVGFVVYYYGPEGMAFNLACKKLGIKSIDIQHGVQGDFHRAYGQWENVPDGGYSLLPSHFWCWDEESSQAINKWALNTKGSHQAFVGGNKWVEVWRKKENPIILKISEQAENLMNRGKWKKVILVTLQTGRPVPEIVLKLLRESSSKWLWLIRLHPNMYDQKEKIKELLANNTDHHNYDLDLASSLPLPAILPNIDVHVTEWSSTVKEAREFNKKSILLHDFGKELFREEIKEQVAYFADNSANIKELIDEINGDQQDYSSLYSDKGIQIVQDFLGN